MIINPSAQITEDVRVALLSALERVPFLKVLSVEKEKRLPLGREVDLLVRVQYKGQELPIVVETKTFGEPGRIRPAIYSLQAIANSADMQAYPIFGGPFLTERSQQLCTEAGVGFIDLAGNCRLVIDDAIFIERTGQPNTQIERKPLRTVFSAKASRVIRKLLCYPKKDWSPLELAKAVSISPALVTRIKQKLVDMEYLSTESKGMKLRNPELVLNEWKKFYSYQDNERLECYAPDSLPETEKEIANYCLQTGIDYGITMFTAANRLEPFVRGVQRLFCYVNDDLNSVRKALNWKTVASGANVVLLKPYDEGVLYDQQTIDDLELVNNVQLYLDLCSNKGRGEEAAVLILERRLQPTW